MGEIGYLAKYGKKRKFAANLHLQSHALEFFLTQNEKSRVYPI
jgi:hypothetical protein